MGRSAHHRHRTTGLAALGLAVCLVAVPGALPATGGDSPLPPAFGEFQQGPDGGTVWEGRIPNGFVRHATRPTVVYLPPGFSALDRYPVVYFLQGFRGSPFQYVSGIGLARVADELIAAHEISPFVAVIPPAGLTVRYDGEWTGAWENYLVDDVVPWTERHLPVAAGMHARILAGLSAGGYGAVDIGIRHPRLFGTLESWSGSFAAPHDGSLRHATAAQLAAHDPVLLVPREAEQLHRLGTRFFLSAGMRDRGAFREAIAFSAELSSLRIPHRLWLGPGGHNGRFWASQLTPALRYALAPPSL